MDEHFCKQVKFFLAGTLNKEDTIAVLDQVKASEECRRYLEEQVRLTSSRHKAHGSPYGFQQRHNCGSVRPPTTPSLTTASGMLPGSSVYGQRRKFFDTKRTLLFGGILAVILYVLPSKDEEKERPPLDAKQVVIAEALMDGSPILLSPKGECSTRPMAISATLPPGNQTLSLVFMSSGTAIFSRSYDSQEVGVEMEKGMHPSTTGELPAVDVLLPFPSKKDLPLEIGKRYFYYIELPNGRQSAPQSIDIR